MRQLKTLLGVGAVLAAVPFAFLAVDQFAPAADHLDPPARTDPAVDSTADRPADIADVYAFTRGSNVVLIMTFAGPAVRTAPATFDRDVLYTINISNDGSRTTPNIPINIRFGEDTSKPGDQFGVQVTGLPGIVGGAIAGPVETNLSSGGIRVRAGLFDDPFFFDLQGFRTTTMTGTLSFDNTRNFFAGQNDTAIVIQIPKSALVNGNNPVDVWATTARFGGQL